MQWCILAFESADVTGLIPKSALPPGATFLKQGLKRGILVHSEQIVKGSG